MLINLTFPKKLRLLTNKEFSLVMKNKKIFFISEITVFTKLNNLQHPRIGITIPKKNVKFSHDRNYIKRIIRESFRANQYKLPYKDFVILCNKNIDMYKDLKKYLDIIWMQKCFM